MTKEEAIIKLNLLAALLSRIEKGETITPNEEWIALKLLAIVEKFETQLTQSQIDNYFEQWDKLVNISNIIIDPDGNIIISNKKIEITKNEQHAHILYSIFSEKAHHIAKEEDAEYLRGIIVSLYFLHCHYETFIGPLEKEIFTHKFEEAHKCLHQANTAAV